MHPALRLFVGQIALAVAAASMTVLVTAFLTTPFNLERIPGEPYRAGGAASRHMT